jgi:phosphoribosylformimino-5-aminoimidazole carboxamide ribotide isomerase
MLIPSIDLKDGQVVQLIQGQRPALATNDIESWVSKFQPFPKVQLIDLDAAMGSGHNNELVRAVVPRLACRVGGGIRTVKRAQEVLGYGAEAVIVGSALFEPTRVNFKFANELANEIGPERIIAAIDSKEGRVVIKGWKESVSLTAVDALKQLEPFCGEFLYTHVDKEGLMKGTDLEAVMTVRRATTHRLTAAGGITTQDEIDILDKAGIDAVVGMAIYTGRLEIPLP